MEENGQSDFPTRDNIVPESYVTNAPPPTSNPPENPTQIESDNVRGKKRKKPPIAKKGSSVWEHFT